MDFLLTAFAPYPSQSSQYSCGNWRSFARRALRDIFCLCPLDFPSSSTGIITIWNEHPPNPRGARIDIRFALGFAISNQTSAARLTPETTFIQSVFSITIGITTIFLSTFLASIPLFSYAFKDQIIRCSTPSPTDYTRFFHDATNTIQKRAKPGRKDLHPGIAATGETPVVPVISRQDGGLHITPHRGRGACRGAGSHRTCARGGATP